MLFVWKANRVPVKNSVQGWPSQHFFFVVVLGLRCYVQAFSPLTASGHFSLVVLCGLLIVASLVAEHRL